MAETYCGKSCSACAQKEQLNCPGCKAGPGRRFDGDCDLAKCCQEKGHEVCDTCGYKESCGTLRSREHQSDYRKRKIEVEQKRKEEIANRAPVLGKWLWVLFWLVVPATVAGVMGNDFVMNVSPRTYMAGQILSGICSIIYGAILLRLSSEEDRYRTAAVCTLISAAVSVLVVMITGAAQAPTWSLVITLPAAIVALVGEYNEYTAHSIVLTGVSNELSEKWTALWKWYIGCLLAMMVSIALTVIVPILGVIVLMASAIGGIVVSTLKLIYLYRTAKIFREYRADSTLV